jgi:hypothetical protein
VKAVPPVAWTSSICLMLLAQPDSKPTAPSTPKNLTSLIFLSLVRIAFAKPRDSASPDRYGNSARYFPSRFHPSQPRILGGEAELATIVGGGIFGRTVCVADGMATRCSELHKEYRRRSWPAAASIEAACGSGTTYSCRSDRPFRELRGHLQCAPYPMKLSFAEESSFEHPTRR